MCEKSHDGSNHKAIDRFRCMTMKISDRRVLFPLAGSRIWVAGHRGMLGSALVRRLQSEACTVITADRLIVDLRCQDQTNAYVESVKPDAIIVAAAKVGGILANATYPAEFLYENLMIAANLIEAARRSGVAKLLFAGSSCIYPKHAQQPIVEEALLNGPLEPTNEWYAIAKIAGIKLCQAYRRQFGCDFISAMPTNLYGPGDNFDLTSSHVVPALMFKAHEAKLAGAREMVVWGTGTPLREFLHVDDCADALIYLLQTYSEEIHINVGSGEEITIRDLVRLIADVVGFTGAIVQDTSKPDGTPRKLMSAARLRAMGWSPRVGLAAGLQATYAWFLEHAAGAAGNRVAPLQGIAGCAEGGVSGGGLGVRA
jgi:GDP-L-fucose synthase